MKFLDLVTFHLAIFMYKYHNYCHRSLILFSLKFRKFIPIIQGLVQNSLIIFQDNKEQIMVYSISDFKVHQYGIPLRKISNYLHCLCLKRK